MTSPAISSHRRETIFWASSVMRDLEAELACALRCDVNVMITGENGLGKKSIARRIHQQSRRAAKPFVVARSPGALDSADTLEHALVEATPCGTVHVEDAEQMLPPMQARLLEFIERRTTQGSAGRPFVYGCDVRFITAANSSLFELVRFRQFSEPLFYRLNVIHLIIPPLRDRPEDIPVLLRHFLSLDARVPAPRLSTAAWQRVVTYAWPGNHGELRTVAETLASRELPRLLEPDDLPPDLSR